MELANDVAIKSFGVGPQESSCKGGFGDADLMTSHVGSSSRQLGLPQRYEILKTSFDLMAGRQHCEYMGGPSFVSPSLAQNSQAHALYHVG